MGLDAYFYRKIKHDEPVGMTAEAWQNVFANADDDMKDLFERMKNYADTCDYSFAYVIKNAMKEFLNKNECYDTDEIVYFRKFHFLNDYFNYTDENYAKDMIVTEEQCRYLYEKADACLKACNKVTLGFSEKVNDICNKFFLCDYKDATYEKVQALHKAMKDIIENTDWGNEYIVYNADW